MRFVKLLRIVNMNKWLMGYIIYLNINRYNKISLMEL